MNKLTHLPGVVDSCYSEENRKHFVVFVTAAAKTIPYKITRGSEVESLR